MGRNVDTNSAVLYFMANENKNIIEQKFITVWYG